MNKVFIDASGQFALTYRKDENHKLAQKVFDQLKRAGVTLVMSDYVFDELLTLISRRIGKYKAIEYSKKFPVGDIMLIFTETSDFLNAKRLFEQHQDKDWSFTDCVSFEVMKRYSIKDALTFDHHFTQAGFNLLK